MSKTRNFSEILDSIKQIKGIKHDIEVAKILRMKQRNLSNAKLRNTIPWEELLTFSINEGISVEWLMTGKGEERPSATRHGGLMLPDEFVLIPQMRGDIEAGPGAIPDSVVELRVAFRRDWIHRKGNPMNMSLIRVRGDSMFPTLMAGDVVLVDHGRNYLEPEGGIYALTLNESIMIKRVEMHYPNGKIKIKSDNPLSESFELEPDRVRINGKVIWFARELEH